MASNILTHRIFSGAADGYTDDGKWFDVYRTAQANISFALLMN